MENNFEEYLKDQITGYRMYPSTKVWQKVHNELHGKQKFAIGGVIALLLIMGLLSLTADSGNLKNNQNQDLYAVSSTNSGYQESTYGNTEFTAVDTDDNKDLSTESENTITTKDNNYVVTTNRTTTKTNPTTAEYYTSSFANSNKTKVTKTNAALNTLAPARTKANARTAEKEEDGYLAEEDTQPTTESTSDKAISTEMESLLILDKDETKKTLTIGKVKTPKSPVLRNTLAKVNFPNTENNSIKIKANTTKVRAQYYITPSISYRSLFDSREKGSPNAINSTSSGVNDLDKSVFHKPGVGFEAGINWLFSLDKRLRLKTGMQLNYNKYNIKATNAQPELTTIALFGSSRALTSVSTLRNNESFFPQWVDNSNLQISIPLGLEFTIAGSDRVEFNIGSSIQPSYLFKNKMYLLSTDLKNYTQEPSLIRRFNINGNIETFITVTGKKLRWQIGPQLRYQFLSTYSKKYPFKENLFDYGFKIGFSKPLR